MNYHLSFNKRSSVLILVVGSIAGALLFVSGYLVGLHRGASRARVELEQQFASQEQKPSAPDSARSPAAPTAPADGAPEATTEAGVAASPAFPPLNDTTPPAEGFSIQAGAFETQNLASRLQEKLAARGYSAFVFQARDSAGQNWFTVRMGHYKDLRIATRAAVAFTMKERMPAHVRPGNGL